MKSNKKTIVISVILTFVISALMFGIFYKFFLGEIIVEKTKKEVTITDQGIADSVEKVYDSVVVVENYINNRLYGTGTGFVFRKENGNGYILTNNHVVENATTIKVIFTNNKSVEVDLVGQDSYSDIAVLSVPEKEIISVAEIGSLENIRVGDTAFAIGAPIDASTYSWTVTRGIISGKNREVAVTSTAGSYLMDVIQTDTAINNGNSGGPLCNSNGEVIGITSLKLASSNIEGMGFAIPIDTAVYYAEKFINHEKIERPYLGVGVYETYDGLYIRTIEKNSEASKAGLKEGDKIVKINDAEINDYSHLKYELYKHNVGDTLEITYQRDGKEAKVKVKLGAQS